MGNISQVRGICPAIGLKCQCHVSIQPIKANNFRFSVGNQFVVASTKRHHLRKNLWFNIKKLSRDQKKSRDCFTILTEMCEGQR